MQTSAVNQTCTHLQLRLGLGLLEDRVKLGGLHHVALDLELSGHEESLGVALARDEVAEVLVGEGESDCMGAKEIALAGHSCAKGAPSPIRAPGGLVCQLGLPVGLVPSPLPTLPASLRSMCQLSVSPALFFRVKAKMAFPCLMASARSASLAFRDSLMTSKAAEAGKASVGGTTD